MATISSLGAGSGLDLAGLLTNLMQAEQQPLLAMKTQEASYQSRISALGSLKSALSTLQSSASSMIPAVGTSASTKFTNFSANVADTTIASASASTGAVAGSYSLEVSSLAQNQRLTTPATSGSPATPTYADANATIATGTLTIDIGELKNGLFTADSLRSGKTITIDSTNNTLGGLRDAINNANIGVSATIVNGTSGAQLIISSNSTGLSNVMKLSGLTGFDFDPAANTGTMTQDAAQGGQAAANAAFKLNGIAATSSTNTVSGVLDGVTLNLSKTTATNTPTTLSISKDSVSGLTSSLNSFIKAYNDANSSMSSLGAYNATTKTAGALQGNSTLRLAKYQISNLFFSATAGGSSAYQSLSDIGVSLAKDGSLSLNSTKLSAAIAADPTSVSNLVSAVGSAYKNAIEGMVGTTGSITTATDSVNRSVTDLAKRESKLSDHLTQVEANYRKQFTALDSLIASMKQTSTALTQQLASLPGVTSSSK